MKHWVKSGNLGHFLVDYQENHLKFRSVTFRTCHGSLLYFCKENMLPSKLLLKLGAFKYIKNPYLTLKTCSSKMGQLKIGDLLGL